MKFLLYRRFQGASFLFMLASSLFLTAIGKEIAVLSAIEGGGFRSYGDSGIVINSPRMASAMKRFLAEREGLDRLARRENKTTGKESDAAELRR